MKRIFSNLIAALFIGLCLRLFFVLKFPAGSGDTVIYEQLASNWVRHGMYAMDIAGQPTSVDLRMPGYPAFLAVIYALTGKFAENARQLVMLAQITVDLVSCVAAGALAALLTFLCNPQANTRRTFVAGVWLAALCPFTANYVAVPLTEVWATLCTTLAFCILSILAVSAASPPSDAETFARVPGILGWMRRFWTVVVVSGFVVGVGTLFRPETPLLLITTGVLLVFWFLRRREINRLVATLLLLGAGAAVPLLPWIVRNAVTLREFQPLAPKDTNLPGEVDPKGFMAWERTWLYRFRDNYLVPWKLNEEAIQVEDLPANAFDTEDERNRVSAVLATYNDELSWTLEEDTVFAQLARERTARHPLRTYVWIPLRRAVRIWFTPRIELIPVSGHVFPLRYMHEEDPVDQRVTLLYFFGNIFYVGLGLFGAWKLWRCKHVTPAVAVILLYILVRTMFLTTLETPEPRYVLVCFPALFAFAAQLFGRTDLMPGNRNF